MKKLFRQQDADPISPGQRADIEEATLVGTRLHHSLFQTGCPVLLTQLRPGLSRAGLAIIIGTTCGFGPRIP
jgi:hypothetical protein